MKILIWNLFLAISLSRIDACSSYDFQNFICEVECVKDFFEYLPKNHELMTNLTLVLKNSQCNPISFKEFGRKLKHLKSLKITSAGCPFRDLNFEDELAELEILELFSREQREKNQEIMLHGHEETHPYLKDLKVHGFCCDRIWNSAYFPKLESLSFRCSDNIISVMSSKNEDLVKNNPDKVQLYAPLIKKYETSMYKFPRFQHFLSNLHYLEHISIYMSFKEYDALPMNFLYNLPSLNRFYLTGLYPLKVSPACENLNAQDVRTVVLSDTSSNFLHSCPEILTCRNCSMNTQHITFGKHKSKLLQDIKPFEKVQVLNATSVRFFNLQLNQENQFPDDINFDTVQELIYENVRGDVNLDEFTKIKGRLPNLRVTRISVENCKKNLIEAMTQYAKENPTLNFECKQITCPMENEEKNFCQMPKKIQIKAEGFDFERECALACEKDTSASTLDYNPRIQIIFSLILMTICPFIIS